MEKFSLYDLLGLLLPGVILIFFLDLILGTAGFDTQHLATSEWLITQGMVFCFAIIAGSFLYAANFYLIRLKWYNWLFGLYNGISVIFRKNLTYNDSMREVLNIKARLWFGKDIFLSEDEMKVMTSNNHNEFDILQNDYYDRMYYELEYYNKIESPKAMQSFYFFFRQSVLAGLLLAISLVIIYCLSLFEIFGIAVVNSKMILLALMILSLIIISLMLAKWYRKRMVNKMFWTYFTHINNNQ